MSLGDWSCVARGESISLHVVRPLQYGKVSLRVLVRGILTNRLIPDESINFLSLSPSILDLSRFNLKRTTKFKSSFKFFFSLLVSFSFLLFIFLLDKLHIRPFLFVFIVGIYEFSFKISTRDS